MRIGVWKIHRFALLLALLASLSFVYGQPTKAPAQRANSTAAITSAATALFAMAWVGFSAADSQDRQASRWCVLQSMYRGATRLPLR